MLKEALSEIIQFITIVAAAFVAAVLFNKRYDKAESNISSPEEDKAIAEAIIDSADEIASESEGTVQRLAAAIEASAAREAEIKREKAAEREKLVNAKPVELLNYLESEGYDVYEIFAKDK